LSTFSDDHFDQNKWIKMLQAFKYWPEILTIILFFSQIIVIVAALEKTHIGQHLLCLCGVCVCVGECVCVFIVCLCCVVMMLDVTGNVMNSNADPPVLTA